MTDLRPDPQGDPLPDRLAGWFDREVRQAAADLRAAPLGSTRVVRRARGPVLAPLAAVAVVVVAVVAGLTRLPGLTPGVEPSGSSSPGSSVSNTPKSTTPDTLLTPNPPLIIDSRYPDGIPSSLGRQNVFRVTNLGGVPSAPEDDSAFLLGGWSFDFNKIVYACTVQLVPEPSFGPRCGTPFLAENPLMDELPRVMLDGWTASIPAGPVVLKVHRHDARAASCAPERLEACENMAVIESLAWAGDSTTATAPREAIDTFMRILEADAGLPQAKVEAASQSFGDCPTGFSCLPPLPVIVVPAPSTTVDPSAGQGTLLHRCQPFYPQESWSVEGASIELVLVFPSTGAREAVDQTFTASGFIGTTSIGGTCQVTTDSFFSRRWIAIDNVMVAVRVDAGGPTVAQAKLIDEVRAALTR